MSLYVELENYVKSLNTNSISVERKAILQDLIDYMQLKVDASQPIRLNFICTHNSRRSHLSQIWAQSMAYNFGIQNVACYSGGTESTALYPMVVETLQEAGFQIAQLSQEKNPIYSIKYAENEHPIIGFSKQFSADFNPKTDFCAIMTCSQADENCPYVPGATTRVALTYDDPKLFDETPLQKEKYAERSLQIATEMYYVFSSVRKES